MFYYCLKMDEYIMFILLLFLLQYRKNVLNLIISESTVADTVNDVLLQELVLSNTNNIISKVENFVTGVVTHYDWKTFRQHFRISKTSFETILQYLLPHWDAEYKRNCCDHGGNEQLSLNTTLLIALWIMATPESYRSVGDRFNVAKSTVYLSLERSVYLILKYICPKFITWPTEEEREQIAALFEVKSGVPNIIGCIDGCHIPIRKPVHNGVDYFNRKRFYSVILQGICKNDLSFVDVDCRWPGSVHDARVFRTSPIYQHIENLSQPYFMLLGDAAYPAHSCILTPFKNNGYLTRQQIHYNTMLSKTRVSIENAFALLKGRFRRLKFVEMYDIQHITNFVICCCTLHNLCLHNEDDDLEQFLEEGREDVHLIHNQNDFIDNNNRQVGHNIRNQIVNFLWETRNR